MKSRIAFLIVVLFLIIYIPYAFSEADSGYDVLITLLSDKVGIPTEYIDDTEMFIILDAINFNTMKASNYVILDIENGQISAGGKLTGKNTKMSIWQNLSYSEVFEAGYLILNHYKEINSASKERFAYAIYNSDHSLYIDTVAEANAGVKKYYGLFKKNQVIKSEQDSLSSAATVIPSVMPTKENAVATLVPSAIPTKKSSVATIIPSASRTNEATGLDITGFSIIIFVIVLFPFLIAIPIAARKRLKPNKEQQTRHKKNKPVRTTNTIIQSPFSAKQRVYQFSCKYQKLCELNQNIQFHEKIEKKYVIRQSFNSKRQLERDPNVIVSALLYNDPKARMIYNELKENRQLYEKYLYEFEKTTTSYETIIESCVERNRFLKIENRICKDIMRSPQRDATIYVYCDYTSPKGNKQYRKSFTLNYSNLLYVYSEIHRKEMMRAHIQMERAKMSDKIRYQVLLRDGERCVICGASAKDGITLHIDHIKPLAKGGKTEMSNLRTLCERCNLGKGTSYNNGGIN